MGITLVHTENHVVSQDRNERIKLAIGGYLYFFDPDIILNRRHWGFSIIRRLNQILIVYGFL